MEIEELKSAYVGLQKKHALPVFDDLNSVFDIGKIERDSGNLLRDVRRAMVEKVAHYLRLMELMLNPSQASPIFLILLKEVTSADKQVLDKVFSSFIEIELYSYKLDVGSSDNDEADFIKKIYGVWNENRDSLLKLLNILERNWKNGSVKNHRTRDYFN
ncbi:MAG: hypothetical protein AABY16_03140 [Nanoarchaeota archaeon]